MGVRDTRYTEESTCRRGMYPAKPWYRGDGDDGDDECQVIKVTQVQNKRGWSRASTLAVETGLWSADGLESSEHHPAQDLSHFVIGLVHICR